MPARTQITRHDCVEGWSCIAKWTGRAALPRARRGRREAGARATCCSTATIRWASRLAGPTLYYETIDLVAARNPQTILAYGLNDETLPVSNGAPLRVRVERQLGYKMAKYIRSIELVDGFGDIRWRQGRLLGRQRLRLVCRRLKRAAWQCSWFAVRYRLEPSVTVAGEQTPRPLLSFTCAISGDRRCGNS